MASFNEKQRAFCVREYYRNNDSSVAQRKFCAHYNIRHKNKAPSIQSIKKWVQKFEETDSTIDTRQGFTFASIQNPPTTQKTFPETLVSRSLKISAPGCSSVKIMKDRIWTMLFLRNKIPNCVLSE